MSLAAQTLSKATLSDIQAWNKLVDQAKSTAKVALSFFVVPLNLRTCSVVCYADAGLVVGLTHHPDLVKTQTF